MLEGLIRWICLEFYLKKKKMLSEIIEYGETEVFILCRIRLYIVLLRLGCQPACCLPGILPSANRATYLRG